MKSRMLLQQGFQTTVRCLNQSFDAYLQDWLIVLFLIIDEAHYPLSVSGKNKERILPKLQYNLFRFFAF